mgnify:CR=1 FL=1
MQLQAESQTISTFINVYEIKSSFDVPERELQRDSVLGGIQRRLNQPVTVAAGLICLVSVSENPS